MVVAPHPDDAEIGAGGTIARWVREGKDVVYVVCTNGDKGTSDRSLTSAALAQIREQEQLAAAKILGVREVVFLRYPDQGLEDCVEFRREMVRQIRRFRPDIVVIGDTSRRFLMHRDHRIATQVTLDAIFPCARDHLAFPELLQEGLEPHRVKEIWFWGAEEINYRSDITDTFELKFAALGCHKSQVGQMHSLEMIEHFRRRHEEMAREEPFELGEGFYRVELRR